MQKRRGRNPGDHNQFNLPQLSSPVGGRDPLSSRTEPTGVGSSMTAPPGEAAAGGRMEKGFVGSSRSL